MSVGSVFSIEEFSIYDGPGIRTTVFLKGCPLRCAWCHSPEGQHFGQEYLRSPNGCLSCGACLRAGEAETGTPCLVAKSTEVCPRNLVRPAVRYYTPEELAEVIRKNAGILNFSGGGVTFSGGEPLSQPDFLTECLTLLSGVTDRALQTSGFCPPEIFATVLPLCDYVLYDLKLMDPAEHLLYCGQSNETILENYRTLAASGKEFITRIPVIPSVNDTVKNLTATAAFLRENGVGRLEMLPYNKLTGSKYALAGRVYRPEFDEQAEPQFHKEIFEKYGIEVKIL